MSIVDIDGRVDVTVLPAIKILPVCGSAGRSPPVLPVCIFPIK